MKNKLHTHPQMEKDLNVPDDHCIVDKEAFIEYSKNFPVKFILDLVEIKNSTMKNQSLTIQREIVNQNNTLYSVLETLIAFLMDKYGVKYNDLRDAFYKNNLTN